jgi:hypothetical protein
MPGWIARLFPTKTLAGVREPTPVRIDARLLSPNSLVSPLSGTSAALIAWRFLAHYTDHAGRTPVERYQLLCVCARGEDLLLATPQGTVLVPAQGLEIRPAITGRGVPLDVPLPPEAAHLMQRSTLGPIFYDELLLRNGDPVRLRATVAPCGGERGSAYRSSGAGRSDFEALPRLGPVVVEDLPFADG